MEAFEVASGLWLWTASHPEWTPGEGWPEQVASTYWDGGDAVCLVDPLVPADEEERFYRHLDADVERAGKPVAIVLTTADHERSAAVLRARYDASVWAWHAERERIETPVDTVFTAGDVIPGGFAAIDGGRPEAVLWLPARGTLVCADVLVGGPLRLAPWAVDLAEQRQMVAALHGLAALPVEVVLVSHGESVLSGGAEALAYALAQATADAPD